MMFTFCASNSPLHPATGEGEEDGGMSKWNMVWSVSAGTLNLGMPLLNHQ